MRRRGLRIFFTPNSKSMRYLHSCYALIILIPLLLSGCAKNPVTGNQNLVLMTQEQEKQMGKQANQQISATMGIYRDDQMQEYLSKIGTEMAAKSHRPELGYTFQIIDSPVPNAFAVPGGYIYFTRGILAHFNNEAEMAGVLGHEIGHIAARHSAQQYANDVLVQTGLQLGSVLSEDFRKYAEVAQLGTSLLFLKFSRDAERQSDELGVEYSTSMGYDATEMANFFSTLERMSGEEGNAIPSFLSTHPDPGQRAKKVRKMASAQMAEEASYSINRDAYLAQVDGMVYGQDPRNGFTDLGHFYHPELAFQFPYPEGWVLQNSNSLVQINPDDQSALIHFMLSDQTSFDAVTQSIGDRYDFEIMDYTDRSVNGLPARILQVRTQNEDQVIRGLVHMIRYENAVYIFLGITSQSEFGNYRDNFIRTAEGFRELVDSDILNLEPARIDVRQISSEGTLGEILRINGVSSERMEETAILNGMELDDIVQAGQHIKIIVGRNRTSS